jgi:hypothetical protein
MRQVAIRVLLMLLFVPAIEANGQAQPEPALSGTFRPSAPPGEPARKSVGSGCVVDLTQVYDLEGSLIGEMTIDFRIFVGGDCAKPPGTFDEHWISHGTYVVRVQGTEYEGALIYLATVRAGGKVEGTIKMNGGLSAELKVAGRIQDGFMRYSGVGDGSESR